MAQENVPIKVGILELLRGVNGAQFVIPAYQRNYTWTAKKEVNQLLDDLLSVLTNERSKHFVGIIIYLEKAITPFHWERSVIDGQQRLTTIFLTLYAMKELLHEDGDNFAAENLESCYLINPHTEINKYKLKPLVSDDEVYQHIVKRDFSHISNRNSNVYKNFIYIKDYLRRLSGAYTLNEVLSAMNKLYIVCVPIGEEDYPQKIFESINATGAKLTASDLIRNFLLMPIISDMQDEYYAKYWKRVEELVDYDAKRLEAFFRFFVMAKKRSLVNKNAVYQSFTKWYDECKNELGIETIFIEIVNYAKYFNLLYKAPIGEVEPELRNAILEYRLNESEMPAPLLMELYSIHMQINEIGEPPITAKQLSDIIIILNSYLMRRSLCGMDTSDISNYFPELLKRLLNFCNGDYSFIVDTFKRFLIDSNRTNGKEMPDDLRLVECIKNANMYRLRQWVSIFFRKLESEDNPAPVDFSALSIEHLMPQTATPLWLASLECDKDAYERNVNRLGNLTFAARSDNSRMGNRVWEYKNKVLASTMHLKMNAQLLNCEKWKLENIDNRTDELIKEIARLYPYFGSKEEKAGYKISIYIEEKDVKASGFYYVDTEEVEIEANSTLKRCVAEEEQDEYMESFRTLLIEKGFIRLDGENLVFTNNFTLKGLTLSLSAGIILNDFSANENNWHTITGKTIGEWIKDYKNKVIDYPLDNIVPSEVISSRTILGKSSNNEILILTKKVDKSFLSSGITLSLDSHKIIQGDREWRLRMNEKRQVKIIIDGEYFDAVLSMYNYDDRPNPVVQLRWPGKQSLIVSKICDIFSEKYYDLKRKRESEDLGIEYKETSSDRYVHIYLTEEPNVLRFKY